MKKLILLVVCAMALAVSSCSKFDDSEIWDKLKNHENRITKLEELCKQLNTNINSLQSIVQALDRNDYITNVSEIRKDGEVIGYTITFAHSDTITIYHGEDGQDGYTPQIGVMKDTDDNYYWTIDGEWLLDSKGNKIKANGEDGSNGTNGSNGQNGANGQDGITPRLKIENDYWYVSYDNGATWTELGKATGEDGEDGADGSDGIDGEDGDSIFSSVTQDDEYVYFNLADGTMITLPKHNKENIQFEDLRVKVICCNNWDTNNDGELSYAEAAAVTDLGRVFEGNDDIITFTELQYFKGITSISNSAFHNCDNLWKIIFPSNITKIGQSAFYNCKSLTTITIPDSVVIIDASAFWECSNLKKITIGNSVREIGYRAFSSTAIEEAVIPNSVVSIGSQAFVSCSLLSKVTIGSSVYSIDNDAFTYCPNLTTIYCKPSYPPMIYAYGNNNSGFFGVFPIDKTLTIYVPRAAYAIYTQYTKKSVIVNEMYKENWGLYTGRIQPYDFE